MFERLLKLAALADTPSSECDVRAERIIGGVRLTFSDGTIVELTVEECLKIAAVMGVVDP